MYLPCYNPQNPAPKWFVWTKIKMIENPALKYTLWELQCLILFMHYYQLYKESLDNIKVTVFSQFFKLNEFKLNEFFQARSRRQTYLCDTE